MSYDADGRPEEYILHYKGDVADEFGTYTYNNTVEIEKRTDADGKEVYKRTRYLEDDTVTELWYTDGEVSKEITQKQNENGKPTECTEKSYGRQREKYTWTYDAATGLPQKHVMYDKNNTQCAAVMFKYSNGVLDSITTEQGKGRKDCQLNLKSGEYVLYEYDEQGNETLREKYSAEDELIARTKMTYDGDELTKTEFFDENEELKSYRDHYTFYTESSPYGEAVEFTEYDAQGKKLYTLLKGETVTEETKYDASERETEYSKTEGDRLIEERSTRYPESGIKEETDIYYDETGTIVSMSTDTYRDDVCIQEELFDESRTLRLRRKYDQNNHPTELSIFDENEKLTDRYVLETTLIGVQLVRHYNSSGRALEQIKTEDMNWYRDY